MGGLLSKKLGNNSEGVPFAKKYKQGRMIGKGGFGKVFECFDRDTNKVFAVKIIEKEKAGKDPKEKTLRLIRQLEEDLRKDEFDMPEDREYCLFVLQKLKNEAADMTYRSPIERIMQEIKYIKECEQKYVIQLVDVFEHSRRFCLVTTRCYGSPKDRYPFDEASTRQWIYQLTVAIDSLHQKDIIHRDIKPDNLMFVDETPESDVVLCDFGMAEKLDSPNGVVKGQSGTVGYMAPEAFDNKTGKPADVWAIGCSVFWLLIGHLPSDAASGTMSRFSGTTHTTRIIRNITDDVKIGKFLKEIDTMKASEECKDALKKMLEKDYKKRITTAELLRHPWFDPVREK